MKELRLMKEPVTARHGAGIVAVPWYKKQKAAEKRKWDRRTRQQQRVAKAIYSALGSKAAVDASRLSSEDRALKLRIELTMAVLPPSLYSSTTIDCK